MHADESAADDADESKDEEAEEDVEDPSQDSEAARITASYEARAPFRTESLFYHGSTVKTRGPNAHLSAFCNSPASSLCGRDAPSLIVLFVGALLVVGPFSVIRLTALNPCCWTAIG